MARRRFDVDDIVIAGLNGIDAMAEVTARPRRLVISCERGQGEDGPGVLVGVRDAGVGAAAHDLEKLFDPFFTTKRDGLGMGLSVGRSIAQAHGGGLWTPKLRWDPGHRSSISVVAGARNHRYCLAFEEDIV